MRRTLVFLIILLFTGLTALAFQIQQYGYELRSSFVELYSMDYLPTIYTDGKDSYIDIKIYDLDEQDLTGAITIGDVGISGDPLYAFRQTVKEKQRIYLPEKALMGLRLIVVSSQSGSAKLMTSYRMVGAQLLAYEDGAMMRLWKKEDSSFIDSFSLYRLIDGELLGRTENGVFVFDYLPTTGDAILVQSANGSILWRPGEYDYYFSSRNISLIFTDRPAYKAGEVVNFRAFIREITSSGYQIPRTNSVEVEIVDPLNRSVFTEELSPDNLGSVSGTFRTYSEITRGSYRIIIRWEGNEDYYYFQIADYKKPTFFTTAESASKAFRKGEAVIINVLSEYYFGDPVSLGKVDYTIYKGSQYIDNGSARLDGLGKAVIGYSEELESGSYYAVITVSDDTGMQSRSTVDFKVVQGTFDFNVDYRFTDKEALVKIETRLNNDTLVSKAFEMKAWYEEPVILMDEGKQVEKKLKINIFREELSTDSGGRAEILISLRDVPPDTVVYFEANGAPSNEPEVVNRYSVYTSGYYDYYGSILVDSVESAAPGSKARVSFYTSSPMDLWVIGDFSGEFKQFPFSSTEGKNTIEIEIPENYGYENFMLFIVGYKNYQIIQSRVIEVETASRDLSINVLTQDRYEPGDTVNMKLQVLDDEGNPAVVGLTVSVVSQAMLSLFEGDSDRWKESLGSPFNRGFNTVSINDLYYSAYPSIAKLGDLLESQPPAAESKVIGGAPFGMGDRGGNGESLTSDVRARKLFSDSAFWSVGTFTDESGFAELSFVVPEDLDTWTVRTLAADFSGDFSYEKSSFETWKPMTVSSFLPEFLIAGDTVNLVFSVKNNLDTRMPVITGFYVDDKVIEEKGATIDAFGSLSFSYEMVLRDLLPSEKDESLRVKFVVEGSRGSDGVEYEIPLKPRYSYIRFGDLDFLEGNRVIEFMEDSIGSVTISSTIDPILLEAIRYLVDYPYGCVEQTMSRLLPALAASQLLAGADESFADKVSVVVGDGLERLFGYQHYDGGWGWWKDDQSTPFMTSYVMLGLYLATENGYDINRDVIAMGYSALKSFNRDKPDPFLQYVITLFSRKLRDPISSIVDYKNDVASIVLTALTYETLNMDAKAVALFEEAMEYVDLGASDVISGSSFNYFFDDTVTLSFLLKAAVDLDVPSATVAEISKRLLKMGNGSYWYRTSSTAMAILSLSSVSSSLSKDAEVEVVFEDGDVVFEGGLEDSITIPITGKTIVIESSEMVAVSINGETAVRSEEIKAENAGLIVERVLRRKVAVPMDDTHVLTTPQIDSPAVVTSIRTLSADEVGSLEISASKTIEGMVVAIVDGELKLSNFGLGLKIYEGDVLGISNGEIIVRSVEYSYYNDATMELFAVKLGEPGPIRVGETIVSEVRIRIPDTVPYVVVEDMLPSTGISVEENIEGDTLGYTKFYYFDYYWWGYTFKDARYDRIAFFFNDGGEFVTKSSWRILTRGEFIIPPVQAWAMYDADYRANTESVMLNVE